jgi:PAS domain S-box-containing protein
MEEYLRECPSDAREALLSELILLDVHYRHILVEAQTASWDDTAAPEADHPPSGNRYDRVREIGAGGMGRVSLCHDREMGRPVALKELRRELAANREALARFGREARVTGRLAHPSIVPVYELVAPADGRLPFYTMRHVEGPTLTAAALAYHAKRRAGQPAALDLLRLLNAFVTVCQAVAYAHTQGVLHRDLKGGNVVLGDFGEVIVLDWGLAKVLGSSTEAPAQPDATVNSADGHTLPGVVTGTPAYMAPEQATGRADLVGTRTDVYGLGAILYEILTGQPPFVGPASKVLVRAANGNPDPPSRLVPDVPTDLETACVRAVSKDPADRYASAGELADAVQRWLADSAERSRAREERERFFGLSLDLLCTIGFDEQFKQLNPAWEKTLGWLIVNLQDRVYLDYIHPDDSEQTRTAVRAVMAGTEGPAFVNRCRHGDGRYRWVSWSVSLIRGEHLVYAVGRDVTEQKEAEEALKRSKERFELAVRGSGVGLWDWDRETGESYYSPRWKSMIGYADHEIPHDFAEWENRVHPDDRERALAALRSCTDDGEEEYEIAYRFQHKDGSYIWILDRGVAVRNSAGFVTRMAGSHTHLTEKRAE